MSANPAFARQPNAIRIIPRTVIIAQVTLGTRGTGSAALWDRIADGSGKYSGGNIWKPDLDKAHRSKMVLHGNSLNVSE